MEEQELPEPIESLSGISLEEIEAKDPARARFIRGYLQKTTV